LREQHGSWLARNILKQKQTVIQVKVVKGFPKTCAALSYHKLLQITKTTESATKFSQLRSFQLKNEFPQLITPSN